MEKERQSTVYNALQSIKNCNIVLIHDDSLVSKEIIEKGIFYVGVYFGGTPGVMPKDTLKLLIVREYQKKP